MYEIRLGFKALLRNRKRTFTLTGVIGISIVFMVLINAFIYTNSASRDFEREKIYGSWSHAFKEETMSDSFKKVGNYYIISDSIGSFDQSMFELANFNLYKGRLPKNENEVVITFDGVNSLGIDYELNQMIPIDDYIFELVGIIYSYSDDWNYIEDIKYPSIITTNIISTNVIHFGESEKLTPFYDKDDYLAVNTNAYPYIGVTGEEFRQRSDEISLRDSQSLKITQFMLIAIVIIYAFTFKNNALFYQKRLNIFYQNGMTKFGSLRYILPQFAFYVFLVPTIFIVFPVFLKIISECSNELRYDNNISILNYATICTLFITVFFFSYSFFTENKNLIKFRIFRHVESLIVFIISFFMIFVSTPQIVMLIEQRIPEWKTYQSILETSMYYTANGSLSGHSDENNLFSEYEAEWTVDNFEKILDHRDTKELYYWNIRYLPNFPSVNYLDSNLLKTLNFQFNISDDFLEGDSFYVLGDNNLNIETGTTVFIGDTPFYFEEQFENNSISASEIPIITGVLISEAGARRIGLPTKTYNNFFVSVENTSSFIEYDALIKRVAGKAYFENARVRVEREVNKEKGNTVFMILEVLIKYSLGIALLMLLFLQKIIRQRKSLAIYHFLGVSKISMIIRNTVSFMVPSFSSIIPATLLASSQSTKISSLAIVILIGTIAVVLSLILSTIINAIYFKKDFLKLLDGRE